MRIENEKLTGLKKGLDREEEGRVPLSYGRQVCLFFLPTSEATAQPASTFLFALFFVEVGLFKYLYLREERGFANLLFYLSLGDGLLRASMAWQS